MTLGEQKQRLRREVLARLQAIPASVREAYSVKLRGYLSGYLEGESKNIAIYYPLPHEVNLLPLLQEYPQHRFAFPRCLSERKLQFHHITDTETQMHPGSMGIPAPTTQTPIIPAQEFDIVVVPGVAFTRSGARLGYGGGYYDRYLPACTQARLIALAFPEQMVEQIATEEHDLRLPHVLSL